MYFLLAKLLVITTVSANFLEHAAFDLKGHGGSVADDVDGSSVSTTTSGEDDDPGFLNATNLHKVVLNESCSTYSDCYNCSLRGICLWNG